MAKEKEPEGKDQSFYRNIGFMCGLEIHQRLATKQKLFCHCPATLATDDDPIVGKISRYQRAVAGELGDIDRSAEFEELRNRKFTYNARRDHTCLTELDEEPPHRLNSEALDLALSFASAMSMRVVDELQPMRKEVVDGSDPSAFQRTVMVAADGMIKVGAHEIKIPSMFLEEESSGIISGTEDSILYDTDRLGIPLVEIDTDPYIPNPAAAKEVALYIGTMLRVSGKVQRGIGSIRQDVNVSIRGGNRVEIKGLQEVDKIDKFIENEIIRQQRLLELKEVLVREKAEVDGAKDITDIFRGSAVRIVTNHLEKGGVAHAFRLKGFKGLLGKEVNPERRLGTEISDYAKMARVNGLIHSDENLQGYGFTDKELEAIRKKLSVGEHDAFVIIAGKGSDAKKATELAIGRAKYALVGVPLETRAVANVMLCTTKFMRPLPGGSRMYPETDAKTITITKKQIEAAAKNAPSIEKEQKSIAAAVKNKELAEQLLLSPKLLLFNTIVESTKADSDFVANVILQKFTELRRAGFAVDSIEEARIIELFKEYGSGKITKQAVDELLKCMSLEKETVPNLISIKRLQKITGKDLEKLIEELKGKSGTDANELRNAIMVKYRLNVDGAELNTLLSGKKSR